MKRIVVLATAALTLALVAPARADETPPPGAPPAGPAAPPSAGDADAHGDAAAAKRAFDPTQPVSTDDDSVHYALGARGRLLLVPGFLLSPFLQQYTTLTSGSFGVEFTRRKGSLDIVTSLDFAFYSPDDGNFLGAGKSADVDTHYTQFKGLNFVSLDVAFIWNHDLTRWLGIMLGGGVGVGVVLGDIYSINNSASRCSKDNAGDTSHCYPVSPDVGDIRPSDPDFQKKLDQTAQAQKSCMANPGADCRDTAGHPYYHAVSEKPPVMVVVNFIVGFRIKLHRHLNVNVSGGFRDGFVVGGGPEYVF